MDNFHYSQLQNNYHVIKDCYASNPTKPTTWNDALDGQWHPVLDGKVVSVDGQATKCRQQPVDYTTWNSLRHAKSTELSGQADFAGPSVEATTGRTRVPYAFATDTWVDTGNVAVFRNDNGADPYEQAQFLITTQENRHIFDNYRRNRSTFSVAAAADRSYERYNSKLLGIATGFGLDANWYKDGGLTKAIRTTLCGQRSSKICTAIT